MEKQKSVSVTGEEIQQALHALAINECSVDVFIALAHSKKRFLTAFKDKIRSREKPDVDVLDEMVSKAIEVLIKNGFTKDEFTYLTLSGQWHLSDFDDINARFYNEHGEKNERGASVEKSMGIKKTSKSKKMGTYISELQGHLDIPNWLALEMIEVLIKNGVTKDEFTCLTNIASKYQWDFDRLEANILGKEITELKADRRTKKWKLRKKDGLAGRKFSICYQ